MLSALIGKELGGKEISFLLVHVKHLAVGGKGEALICGICQFPWGKYSHCSLFQVINMSLKAKLEIDAHN